MADVNKELGLRGKRFTFARLFYSFLFKTDVAKEQDIFYCKKWLIIFGTIHILINNAGKFQHKSFYDVILDEWDDLIQTNSTSFSRCHGILPVHN
ncbi:SDR family NAD(P)-dependent oxidoreductase [Lysinibacillus sp. Ag94]|uniref:SDR family NAD(P)-dependent oxidoreductase n=1 Tax=Lysinibacillus sp. Ag94 TaxID=2936682 RepID=UPI00353089EA